MQQRDQFVGDGSIFSVVLRMEGSDDGATWEYCARRQKASITGMYTEGSNVRLVFALRCEDPCCCAEDCGDQKSNEGCPARLVSCCFFDACSAYIPVRHSV